MSNGTNPQEQVEWLQTELQDAQLVIGQQQIQMLKQQKILQALQQRIMELEAQTEPAEDKEKVTG